MYWSNQEKVVFGLISFLAVAFHVSSVLILIDGFSITLFLGNLVVFAGMVRYARWVYQGINYLKATGLVLLYESIPVIVGVLFWFYFKVFVL